MTAALFTFVAFLGAALWETAREDDNLSSADGWGRFGVFVAAYATPAFALVVASCLMLIRRRAALSAVAAAHTALLAVMVASAAIQIIRSSIDHVQVLLTGGEIGGDQLKQRCVVVVGGRSQDRVCARTAILRALSGRGSAG